MPFKKRWGRRVALKVLAPVESADVRQLERFRREATTVARLDHPHIVPVYGFGDDNGRHYYAMRFIDGRTLREWIGEQRAALHGTLSDDRHARDVSRFGVCIAEALAHAHAHGVLHRGCEAVQHLARGRRHDLARRLRPGEAARR